VQIVAVMFLPTAPDVWSPSNGSASVTSQRLKLNLAGVAGSIQKTSINGVIRDTSGYCL